VRQRVPLARGDFQMDLVARSELCFFRRKETRMTENIYIRTFDGGAVRSRDDGFNERLAMNDNQTRAQLFGTAGECRNMAWWNVRQLDTWNDRQRKTAVLRPQELVKPRENFFEVGAVAVVANRNRGIPFDLRAA